MSTKRHLDQESRRDVNVWLDATGKSVEAGIAIYIRAGDLPIASAREIAKRILDKCDDADACLKKMRDRQRKGFRGVQRYPNWKKPT